MKKIEVNSNLLTKNNIYNIDCLELIKKMKDQNFKVDLILTDPPYNVSRENNFKTIGRAGIDFGKWDKNFDQLKWLDGIGEIVNKDGSILIFNDWKNMGLISEKLEKEGFEVKDLIRWIKPAPMPRNTDRRYVTDFEFVIWATKKGGKWTFNNNSEKYLRPEYEAGVPLGDKRIHPTEKPEYLIQEIIRVHSNAGDLIFDPFSGSGTISVVADKLDRYFIASELDKKYYDASIKRLNLNYPKPAFNHLGNKWRMIIELIGNFPKKDIDNFVEPFAGSAIVTSSYKSAKKYWLNDKDEHLSEIIDYLLNTDSSVIIKNTKSIIKKYNLPINSKKKYNDEYLKLRKSYNKSKNISELLVLILYGFNQQIRFNSKDEFNIPVGKFYWNEYHEEKLKSFIENCKDKKIKTSHIDFYDFIKNKMKDLNSNHTLFYFDPPYFLSNATYNSEWGEEEEKKLINCLEELTCKGYKWCLSNVIESKGKVNNFLIKFIEENKNNIKWKVISDINYRNSNYQRSTRNKNDVEILIWGNYE